MTGMTFADKTMNLMGILIAAGAVLISFITVLLSRRQRRQDIFLRVQEILSDESMQHGRWLIHQAAESGKFPARGTSEAALIYRTLRMHNTVAMYVRRRLVSQRWVLDAWHHSLGNLNEAMRVYVTNGTDLTKWYVASEFTQLTAMAAAYRTSMPCCQPKPAGRAGTS